MLFENINGKSNIFNISSPGNFYDNFFYGFKERIYNKNLQHNYSFLKKIKIFTIDIRSSEYLNKKLFNIKNLRDVEVSPIENLSILLDETTKKKLTKKKKI